MERDFMGLNSRAVKEEFVDGGSEDSGFARSSGVTWLFSNKVSAVTPPKYDQNEKQSKNSAQHFFLKPPAVSPSSVVGVTEQRVINKPRDLPAQLTIFYGGSVTVFDNITPEKAKALMCLAGKLATPPPLTFDQQKVAASGDRVVNSRHASPISVSSHPTDAAPAAAINDTQSVKVEASITRPTSAAASSAVPQARKASLARFLEKRKERVMTPAPYTIKPGSGPEVRPPSGKEGGGA